jgi:hypothetical protein
MPDEVPTVAELERLAATPNQYVCASVLARVCRHALALEAEVARLRQQVEDNDLEPPAPPVPDDQLPRLSDLRGLLKHEVHEDDGDSE